MNEISTSIMSHVIVFHDESVMNVSEKQFHAIEKLKASKIAGADIETDTGQHYIQFSAIAKILTREEYLIQYPEKEIIKTKPIDHEPNFESNEARFIYDETRHEIDEKSNLFAQRVSKIDLEIMVGKFLKARNNGYTLIKKFLQEEGAINSWGAVIADMQVFDKRRTSKVPMKFFVYRTMAKHRDRWQAKKKYAEEKSWGELMKVQS